MKEQGDPIFKTKQENPEHKSFKDHAAKQEFYGALAQYFDVNLGVMRARYFDSQDVGEEREETREDIPYRFVFAGDKFVSAAFICSPEISIRGVGNLAEAVDHALEKVDIFPSFNFGSTTDEIKEYFVRELGKRGWKYNPKTNAFVDKRSEEGGLERDLH